MSLAVNFDKLSKTVDELGYQGDVVASLEKDSYVVMLETNGGEWYEIVIYEKDEKNHLHEVWFSDCIYDEDKPKNKQELKGLMLDCLDLIK